MKNKDPEELIKELKRIKKEEGLSFSDLASELGVYKRTVTFWFAGDFKPSPMACERIEKFLRKRRKNGKAILPPERGR